ncbi:PEP-CTERM sorting domain-containing protein [Pelomonas sp. CA6]|uniref:PEP-CTERM sorting domain-containing protein n=1 Tax=Pelomonas sp. CA6 TaxID=2907999 RepID=UPI001F4BEA39|nr:PEP-CTERM sorting domain-containing protein [Pelomonas sp. CA6]MCH7344069.1 PEP-CTERM sorting domain-containing protein [Pelomonas sp. CA6]
MPAIAAPTKTAVQLLLAMGFALGALQAQAGNANLSSANQTKGTSATVYFGDSSRSASFRSQKVTDTSSNESFWVYCVDPLTSTDLPSSYTTMSLSDWLTPTGSSEYKAQFSQGSYTSSTYTNPASGNKYIARNEATVLSKLTELYAHAYAEADPTKSGNDTKVAAFQWAVWELEGESNYSSTAGGLRFNTAAATPNASLKTQVDAYLSALASGNWSNVNGTDLSATTNYTYTVYQSNNFASQSFLRVTAAGNSNNVPEPGSLALAGMALFGVFSLRRKGGSTR